MKIEVLTSLYPGLPKPFEGVFAERFAPPPAWPRPTPPSRPLPSDSSATIAPVLCVGITQLLASPLEVDELRCHGQAREDGNGHDDAGYDEAGD